MTVKDLKEKLAKMPNDLKVYAMNSAIEWDETCPGFSIVDTEMVDDGENEMFMALHFVDEVFIRDDVNLALAK